MAEAISRSRMRFFPKISRSLLLALCFTPPAFAQVEWIARNSQQTQTLFAVAWTGKLLVTVGANGVVSTSPTGSQWTRRTAATSRSLNGVAGVDSLLVAVGSNGTILRSVDGGASWNTRNSGTSNDLYGVAHANGLFVAVGAEGTLRTSLDGLDWTSRSTGTSTDLNAIAWNGSRIVAVGDNGLIRVSTDGTVWSNHSINTSNEDVDAVVWTGSLFVAMGENNVMLTSPDGLSWTPRPGPGTVRGVAWNGSRLVAVGIDGAGWTSPDGTIWTSSFTGTAQTLRAITWTGSRLVVVGSSGILYTVESVSTPPEVPVPGSPQVGASGVPLLTHLAWEPSPTAISYRVQVSTDSTFTTFLVDTLVNAITLEVLLTSHGTAYFWRVAGVNEVGTGEYSNIRRFETISAPTTPPPAPVLIVPAQFASRVQLEAQLRWGEAATATHYRVQVSRTPDFSSLVVDDSTLSANSRSITVVGNSEYYWRVRGRNAIGSGPWSEIRSFQTVTTAPDAPVLLHPAPFAVDVPVTATLRWARTSGATSYTLQVSKSPEFAVLVASVSINDTQSAVGSLEGFTDYYWRVRGYNSAASAASPYSSVRRFTTGALPRPAVPVLVSPAPFAADLSPTSTIQLTWEPAAYAATYRLQLSTTPDFSTLLRGDSGISGLSRGVGPLSGNTNYYWRVQAVNATGTSDWSEIRNFSTASLQVLSLEPVAFSLRRETFGAAPMLRFVLEKPGRVQIRLMDVRGREAMPAWDRLLDAGAHEIMLAPDLAGAWYVLDFRAGDRREVLKFRP